MTTILADAKAGIIVADSNIAAEDRIWSVRKIVRSRGMLMAAAGALPDYGPAIDWFKANGLEHPDETPPTMSESSILILLPGELWLYDYMVATPQRVTDGYEAVGSGAVAALAAYRGIGKRTPAACIKAVRIACGLDNSSRPPVRSARVSQ